MTVETADPIPAVKIKTCADDRAIEVAGKLAAGAAEALALHPGPAQRIKAVIVEATKNVVDHAYADLPLGDVEIGMTIRLADLGSGRRDRVEIMVRDFGGGCPLAPTSSEPPGLGLSILSELSEELTIRSDKHGGTEVAASIEMPSAGAADTERAPASRGSRIDFSDPRFLLPVIPRAIAVHASSGGGSMDAVRSAINGGRSIAESIQPGPVAEHGATISIDQPDGSPDLEVRMGPMPSRPADGLLGRLRTKLDLLQRPRIEGTADDRTVMVALPLL